MEVSTTAPGVPSIDTRTAVADATSLNTSSKKIRKPRKPKISTLSTIIGGGSKRPTGVKLSKKLGVSLSTAHRAMRLSNKFPISVEEPYQLFKIRKQKHVCALMSSLSDQMVCFTNPIIVKMFEENGLADITETMWADKTEASTNRRKRANIMWDTYYDGFFKSREPYNTLVCVFYEIDSLVRFVRAIQEGTHEFVSNLLVVRMAGVFVVVLTDARRLARYPADWLLRIGDHTSAFMWMNVSDHYWMRYTTGAATDFVDVSGSSKKRKQVSTTTVSKTRVWTKTSEGNVVGMHFLCYIWRRIEVLLATNGVIFPDSTCIGSSSAVHLHVRPVFKLPSVAKAPIECNVDHELDMDDMDDTPDTDVDATRRTTWCEDVVDFAESFSPSSNSEAAAVIAVPKVVSATGVSDVVSDIMTVVTAPVVVAQATAIAVPVVVDVVTPSVIAAPASVSVIAAAVVVASSVIATPASVSAIAVPVVVDAVTPSVIAAPASVSAIAAPVVVTQTETAAISAPVAPSVCPPVHDVKPYHVEMSTRPLVAKVPYHVEMPTRPLAAKVVKKTCQSMDEGVRASMGGVAVSSMEANRHVSSCMDISKILPIGQPIGPVSMLSPDLVAKSTPDALIDPGIIPVNANGAYDGRNGMASVGCVVSPVRSSLIETRLDAVENITFDPPQELYGSKQMYDSPLCSSPIEQRMSPGAGNLYRSGFDEAPMDWECGGNVRDM